MVINDKFGWCVALAGMLALAGPAQAKKCPADSVQVGHVCIDKYEESAWEIAPNASLIKQVLKSKIATAADMVGATQRGATGNDYGAACPATGNGCKNDYAVSIPAVTPSASLTWFQAAAICRNAGKRLATNAEWQAAAFGTPDPGTDNGTTDCNILTAVSAVSTGSRSLCVSDTGAFDMVGNLNEWVADWGEVAAGCTHWDAAHGSDITCIGGSAATHIAGALYRGGDFFDGTDAGVFAAVGYIDPSTEYSGSGFRCAREL